MAPKREISPCGLSLLAASMLREESRRRFWPRCRMALSFAPSATRLLLSPVLARIPIYVVLNEDAPVWGAAYQAFCRNALADVSAAKAG